MVKSVIFTLSRKLRNQLLIVGFLVTGNTIAQEIDSIRLINENGMMVVQYDFNQDDVNIPYELYLYGSHDNFSKPLQFTKGDIGKNIFPGKNKKLTWDAARELGNFKGDLIVKIKGSAYKPFVTFVNVPDQLALKKGTSYTFDWTYDKKPEKVMLSIMRNGVPLDEPKIIDNLGKFVWTVPNTAKAAKGYTLRLQDPENLLREEMSHSFTIKRKIALGYAVIPVAVLGAAAIILLSDEDGIPSPPSTPSN